MTATYAILYHLNFSGNQAINMVLESLASDPGSPTAGRVWYITGSKRAKIYDSTTNQTIAWLSDPLNSFATPTSDLSMGTHRIINVTDPSSAQDAATKNYVDNLVNGKDWKDNVKWATAAALPSNTATTTTLTATANAALVVDGGNPAANDRVLVKNEATGANNGLYLVTQTGDGTHPYILTRTTDGSAGELTSGASVVVEGGTGATNNNTAWTLTTADPITVGTTSQTWSFLPGAGSVSASNLGGGTVSWFASMSGTTLQFNTMSSANSAISFGTASNLVTITFNAGNVAINTLDCSTPLTVAHGGTGSSTASGARTNLVVPSIYTTQIGDGASTTITVTHNLGTKSIVPSFRDTSDNTVGVAWQAATTNTMVCTFNTAPATNAINVTVHG